MTQKPFALILSDTHLSTNNILLVKDIFKQAITKCKELKIDNIFHLGDFFHSREAQPEDVLTEGSEIMKMISQSGLQLYICDGNHDKVHLESEKSYITSLEKYSTIHYSKESIVDILHQHDEKWNDLNIIWLPYFKEKGSYMNRLQNAVKMIKKGSINVLNTHVGINGVINNDGSAHESEIKQELFKKFDKVFVGHYHNQQNVKNIFYIGGAFQQNYGEDELKGFTILYTDGSHEFIQSSFPKYIKHKVNIDNKKELSRILSIDIVNNDNHRIILTGEKTKLQAFDKTIFYDKGFDVKFEADEIVNNFISDKKEITIYDRSNLKTAFKQFTVTNQIDDSDFGQKYLDAICG